MKNEEDEEGEVFVFLERFLECFFSSQSKKGCKGCEEALGHGCHSLQTAERGGRLARCLKGRGDAIFTFFSLRGNKAPDLSSLICGSIRVAGSSEPSTSLTVHFWKT